MSDLSRNDVRAAIGPDRLGSVAERLHIATDASAGPLGATGLQVWARWPRHRLALAHEVLARVRELDGEASLELADSSGAWRARVRDWSFTGDFEEAVARLASRVCDRRRGVCAGRSWSE